MNDSWEKLNGEVVEREVTQSYKVGRVRCIEKVCMHTATRGEGW